MVAMMEWKLCSPTNAIVPQSTRHHGDISQLYLHEDGPEIGTKLELLHEYSVCYEILSLAQLSSRLLSRIQKVVSVVLKLIIATVLVSPSLKFDFR